MKKVMLLFSLILSGICAHAQMSRWVIQPVYDKIYLATGAPFIVSDSLGTSTLWDLEGEKIAMTTDSIHPYRNGYAITTRKGTDVITGFYDLHGEFTPTQKDYTIAYPDCCFSDGYMIVKANGTYRFINTEGKEVPYDDFIRIYPFNNGYAVCSRYEFADKQRNPYYTYVTDKFSSLILSYNNRFFEKSDIEFLSSLSDEGRGIAIIKRRLYYFDKEELKLSPIFATQTETNIKKQVAITGSIEESITYTSDLISIDAYSDKKKKVVFYFDQELKPVKIVFPDRTEYFKEREEIPFEYSSPYSAFNSEGVYGLKYNNKVILPAQFEKIGLCINKLAAARHNGKWGMLTYDSDLKYRLIIHDGKDIAFRHKDVGTTIKLELPPIISADKCRFDVGPEYGCTIDKMSLETKNTENGNYVQYKCRLSIPDSLPDVITEIRYPVQITYEGIRHPVATIRTNAWHYKYINVDLDDSETTINQGNVSFTINISADKQPGESDYPFDVDIKTDSLRTELIKISETRYKCNLFSLAEGVNTVNINILESGCPPSIFTFEITYVKPVEKSRNTPEVKEAVKIEKKINVKRSAPKVAAPVLPI
ncbi:MAG TPA: WG repeat-containing protein [Candidatus Alistipes merdavium]|nr:WG repeat-containing protein [Candidatus Alistipes merdavium]